MSSVYYVPSYLYLRYVNLFVTNFQWFDLSYYICRYCIYYFTGLTKWKMRGCDKVIFGGGNTWCKLRKLWWSILSTYLVHIKLSQTSIILSSCAQEKVLRHCFKIDLHFGKTFKCIYFLFILQRYDFGCWGWVIIPV